MGDQTFSRMYCDNTTDDGGYCDRTDNTGSSPALLVAGGDATGEAAAAAPSPAPSQAAPPAPSPAPSAGRAYPPAAPVPNWTAPAFVPPYAQAPAGSSAPSDHPALVHSPDVTGSSFNTLETRRVSVGVDMRRASISSRRFSMQDATGRLLADDGLLSGGDAPALPAAAATPAGEALPPADARALASSGPRSRRRSSGAACEGTGLRVQRGRRGFLPACLPGCRLLSLGRRSDVPPPAHHLPAILTTSLHPAIPPHLPAVLVRGDVTEALLADEEDSLGGDEGGALADLKRQMRLLSQSSPVAALVQPEAVAAVAAAAEEEAAELAAAELQAEQAVHPTAAPAAAKTPRAAVSMGYADSHNPATAALLRSNGTTRLLADSLGVADDDDEEDLLADDGEEGGGATGGPSPAGMRLGDAGGVTARTNGTTKLLADMTMASVVGAKLLGRPGVAGGAGRGCVSVLDAAATACCSRKRMLPLCASRRCYSPWAFTASHAFWLPVVPQALPSWHTAPATMASPTTLWTSLRRRQSCPTAQQQAKTRTCWQRRRRWRSRSSMGWHSSSSTYSLQRTMPRQHWRLQAASSVLGIHWMGWQRATAPSLAGPSWLAPPSQLAQPPRRARSTARRTASRAPCAASSCTSTRTPRPPRTARTAWRARQAACARLLPPTPPRPT